MLRIAPALLALPIVTFFALGSVPRVEAQGDASGDEETSTASGSNGGRRTSTSAGRTGTTTRSYRSTELEDEQAAMEERNPPPTRLSGFEPIELEDHTYVFLGAMVRALVVPTFIQNIFVAGGSTPINGGFGIFFNYRRNRFNVLLEAYYQSFYNEGFYRGVNDAETETEFIRSRLGVVMGNIGFGWAFDITDWFAFEFGFGLGLGGMIGDLYRQEAYRDSSGQYQACMGPDDPNGPGLWCESPVEQRNPANGRLDNGRVRGGTYQLTRGCNGEASGTCPNPHYFGEGGIPPIFFNVDLPRIAFRIKPLHQLQLRIEGAYNLYGFSFGSSAAFGF
jgi:hypothetical protein